MKIFWRYFKDYILSYSYKSGQYFLISFPKTGRTWLMYMIRKMNYISTNPSASKNDFIYSEHDNSEIILENGIRNNSMDTFNFIKRYRFRRARVIFLVRDPRDVIVSHYHQITKRSKNPFKFDSMSIFVRDKILGFNRIINFYNIWYKNRFIPKEFLLVRYEDLLNNGYNELKKIDNFLSLNLTESEIKDIYKSSSADKMRSEELSGKLSGSSFFGSKKNQLKVRNAKSGSYKDELLINDINYCNKSLKILNKFFKY